MFDGRAPSASELFSFARMLNPLMKHLPSIAKVLQTPLINNSPMVLLSTKTQNNDLFKKFQQAVICDPFPLLVARDLEKEESNVE